MTSEGSFTVDQLEAVSLSGHGRAPKDFHTYRSRGESDLQSTRKPCEAQSATQTNSAGSD